MKLPKKVKKVSKSKLKRKCDALFSLIIRKRGKCQKCGKTENLQCAHVITRGNIRLRYDENNALCLCSGDHLWWHHDPFDAIAWFNKKFPDQAMWIRINKDLPLKLSLIDYQDLYKRLTKV